MRVLVALEQRFARTPDGAVWTDGQFPYPFWRRYLDVFDEVRVVARVRESAEVGDGWLRTDGPGVLVDGTPHYHGMWQYFRQVRQVRRAIRDSIQHDAAVILRIGSQIANVMYPALLKAGHPFGVEVVADPYGVFSPGGIRHPLRPLLRWHFTRIQQLQCRAASAAAYVTNEQLQRRYPVSPGAVDVACSDVELSKEAFAPAAREFAQPHEMRIVTVGVLSQPYKRIDVLIDAVHKVLNRGCQVSLTIVGDGRFRADLESQAASLGLLGGQVRFAGQLAGANAVRDELWRSDLFVIPSRHEGLPRALVEAMAAGLPCIGTRVGGIPELLDEDDLVAAGDVEGLADKICQVVGSCERMQAMSLRNLQEARQYSDVVLHQRRKEFYQHVRDITQRWLEERELSSKGKAG